MSKPKVELEVWEPERFAVNNDVRYFVVVTLVRAIDHETACEEGFHEALTGFSIGHPTFKHAQAFYESVRGAYVEE